MEFSLAGGPVRLRGCLAVDASSTGVRPVRLPQWARARIPDLAMRTVVEMTSGVRVCFATEAESLTLELVAVQVALEGDQPTDPVLDLVIDGEMNRSIALSGSAAVRLDPIDRSKFRFEPATTESVVHVDGLGSGRKEIEVWLPTDSSIKVFGVSVPHGEVIEPPSPANRVWLHYGSSISHGMDVGRPLASWPAQAARQVGLDLINLGFAGQCQLDPFMGRAIGEVDAAVISLKLGINLVNAASMTERTFVPAVHGLLDSIRSLRPTTPLLLISPIACPMHEDHPGPTVPTALHVMETVEVPAVATPSALTLRRIRELLESIAAQRRTEGDFSLHLLDGLELFGPADVDELYDGLHPTPEGHRRMSERFADYAFGTGGPFAAATDD